MADIKTLTDEQKNVFYPVTTTSAVYDKNGKTVEEIIKETKLSLPLGILVPSSVVQDDAGLHLADGTLINQDGVYAQFATWIKTKYPSGDYTQAQFDSDVATYGQCGHYVIDDTAGTIRLPLITEFIASNNGGQAIGLAQLDEFKRHTHILKGFRGGSINDAYSGLGSRNNTAYTVYNDNINGMQDTGGSETRPKNIRYPYYIVVATGVKTPIEVDIDNVVTDINSINATLRKTEQIEVVYDISDTNKQVIEGVAYTNGIPGIDAFRQLSNIKFTETKRYRFTLNIYAGTNATNFGAVGLVTELSTTFVKHNEISMNGYVPYLASGVLSDNSFRYIIRLNTDGKLFFRVYNGGAGQDNAAPIYAITKIERIY